MFMSAATTPTPTIRPDPNPAGVDKGSRVGRLLHLVRRLIDYGRELAASFQPRSFATDSRFTPFGTSDIRQILATIRRGLHRANALEARLLRDGACLDAGPRSLTAPSPRMPRATQPTTQYAARADAHL